MENLKLTKNVTNNGMSNVRKIFITCILLLSCCFYSFSEPEDATQYRKHKEQIINLLINTPQFDSIYG